jgi:hypothetical protein
VLSAAELQRRCDALELLFEEFSSDAADAAASLAQGWPNGEGAPLAKRVAELAAAFDFEGATEALRLLRALPLAGKP